MWRGARRLSWCWKSRLNIPTPLFDRKVAHCAAVRCPVNSVGTSVADGCTCLPGFFGLVLATKDSPFFEGGCEGKTCVFVCLCACVCDRERCTFWY
jgi:hypothetical protein